MDFHSILVHIHSGLRWIVLLFILFTIVHAAVKLIRKDYATDRNCYSTRLSMTFMHLQLIIGLILYFISPKVIFSGSSMSDPILRFFLVEHISLMLIAVVLITVGYVKTKKLEGVKKYRTVLIYYIISLLLILASIPWPFRDLGGKWF